MCNSQGDRSFGSKDGGAIANQLRVAHVVDVTELESYVIELVPR